MNYYKRIKKLLRKQAPKIVQTLPPYTCPVIFFNTDASFGRKCYLLTH